MPGLVIAQMPHHVNQHIQSGRFQAQQPFPVVQAEGRNGVGPDIREVLAELAVGAQQVTPFGRIHGVPVVGAHKRVEAQPFAGFAAHREGRHVVPIELRHPVGPHGGKGYVGSGKQIGATHLADGLLQGNRVLTPHPHHHIGFGSHTGDVIETPYGDALFGQISN